MHCPECGRPFSSGVIGGGLCPRCLFAVGLEVGQQEAAASPAPQWQIVALIGEGPNGRTYLAEQRTPGRRMVAVKIITPLDRREAARVRIEAALPRLASMVHPNIAAIIGGGTTAEGQPYLVTEYIAGVSLERARERSPMPLGHRLVMARQVASALEYTHGRGEAHGHVVEANVLLPRHDPRVARLTDYGTSEIAGRQVTAETDVTALLELIERLLPEVATLDQAASAAEAGARIESEIDRLAG